MDLEGQEASWDLDHLWTFPGMAGYSRHRLCEVAGSELGEQSLTGREGRDLISAPGVYSCHSAFLV